MTTVWTADSVLDADRGDVCRIDCRYGNRNPVPGDFVTDHEFGRVWRIKSVDHAGRSGFYDVLVEMSA